MSAIIFDTETTGITEPRVIEAAWFEVTPQLTVVSKFCQRYDPQKPIEFGALAIHHIMDEDLAGMPAYTDFKLPDECEYIIGHNVDYDWGLIGKPDVKRICVLALCRYLWPQLDSHSLSAMLYFVNRRKAREQLKAAHSAEVDVMNCMRILWRVLSVINDPDKTKSWEQIWAISEKARIPTVISFGKHKGMALKDLPADYKHWLLGQPWVDPYLAKALREIEELRWTLHPQGQRWEKTKTWAHATA
jgi:exodeoxyribonuclease X